VSWLEYLTARATLDLMRVLIIGTYRSEECPDALNRLMASSRVTSISLKRLEATDVASMVGDMLALRPSPPLFGRYLAQHSEGNPFFVAEYLRMAVGENS
jgi:predicted ATPase